MRVLDVMSIDVVTISPEASIKEAARLMVEHRVSGLPVVDGSSLVGIITEADFLDQTAAKGRVGLLTVHVESEPVTQTVGEVMTPHPHVVYQDASVTEVARAMSTHGVKRLPVVDNDGGLIGVISRADIMAAFCRPDDVIRDEIRHDLLERVLRWDPDSIEVSVTDGVVSLRGAIPQGEDPELLEELVRRMDSVVGVYTELVSD